MTRDGSHSSRRVKVEHTGQRCAGIVIGQLDHANTVPSVRTTAIQKTVKRLIQDAAFSCPSSVSPHAIRRGEHHALAQQRNT